MSLWKKLRKKRTLSQWTFLILSTLRIAQVYLRARSLTSFFLERFAAHYGVWTFLYDRNPGRIRNRRISSQCKLDLTISISVDKNAVGLSSLEQAIENLPMDRFRVGIDLPEADYFLRIKDPVIFRPHFFNVLNRELFDFLISYGEFPQLVYWDDDVASRGLFRSRPHFKSGWNRTLLLSQDYIGSSFMLHSSLVKSAQDLGYDTLLSVRDQLKQSDVLHIPKVLWHFKKSVEADREFEEQCLLNYFEQKNLGYKIKSREARVRRIEFTLPESLPSVSIIIPTRDRVELLQPLVESILELTSYKNFEILIADNETHCEKTLAYLESLEQSGEARILRVPGEFNFSKINNIAVGEARGEILCFLNNDTRVIREDWLQEMVSHAVRSEVGAVGAKLYYPDGSLQHAGVMIGMWGLAGHRHHHLEPHGSSYLHLSDSLQNVSAVTAACLAMRKKVFEEVQGFDEVNLKVAFNDVDLCLKVIEKGYEIVWSPHAELIHYESASRGNPHECPEQFKRERAEGEFMIRKWGKKILSDYYYNPNLSYNHTDFRLAFPPTGHARHLIKDSSNELH